MSDNVIISKGAFTLEVFLSFEIIPIDFDEPFPYSISHCKAH